MTRPTDRPHAMVVDAANGVRDRLREAAERGASRVVLVSSARAYGAWPDNPVPLTEDANLRPNPGCELAARCAEGERLAQEWRETTGRELVVLRAAEPVGDRPPARLRGVTAPVQFLHADDLASAIDLAASGDLEGVYNVAPDGWTSPDTAAALVRGPLSFARPVLVARLRATRGELAYRLHPWVVANDRLRAAGWRPAHSSEEAWVVSHGGARLERLSPEQRQQVALGGIAAGLATLSAIAVAVVRSRRR